MPDEKVLSEVAKTLNFKRPYGFVQEKVASIVYDGATKTKSVNVYVPTLLVGAYTPTIGDLGENKADNPIAVAQAKYYLAYRQANSSLSAYSAADVMKYIIAIANLYALFAECARALKIINTYKKHNVGLNEMMKQAIANTGVTAFNIAEYRARLVHVAKSMTALPVPSTVPFINRWLTLSGNVFKDDDIENCGYILFTLADVLEYDVSPTSRTVGSLLYTRMTGTLINKLEALVAAYLADQDMSNLGSEMIKALGDSVIQVDVPAVDAVLTDNEFKFDVDIVDAFKNADIASCRYAEGGYASSWGTQTDNEYIRGIAEDSEGQLKYGINWSTGFGVGQYWVNFPTRSPIEASNVGPDCYIDENSILKMLYTHAVDPSVNSRCELLRFKHYKRFANQRTVLNPAHQGYNTFQYLEGMGTEVIDHIRMYQLSNSGTVEMGLITSNFTGLTQSPNVSKASWMAFAATPILYTMTFNNSTTSPDFTGYSLTMVGDIDNFARLNFDQLKLIQKDVLFASVNADNIKLTKR